MTDKASMDISASWDGCELDLACSLEGFRKLIDVLRRNELGVYKLKMGGDDYKKVDIFTLEIESRSAKLILAIDDKKAIFSGNLPSLQLLADNLDFLYEQWSSNNDQHLHLEPISNSFLFSPESEAFIVSQQRSGKGNGGS
jgi:hypothetical protein